MKWTSRAAYDGNKTFQPNMRWDILLLLRDGKWRTSQTVHAELGRGELGSVKSRLRELELMGCIICRDRGQKTRSNAEAMSYKIAAPGEELLKAGHLGQWINAEVSGFITDFNTRRALALQTLKAEWRARESAEVSEAFDNLMDLHLRSIFW